jgi:rhodanese-related sulfurtransferase
VTEFLIGRLAFRAHESIAPDALMEQIRAGTAPVIIDVRSKREFDAGHVPGATHVPFWQIGRRSRTFVWMSESPMVLYCGHGPRAHIAAAGLVSRGFTRVVYLAGHMKKWKEMNLPIEGQ